MAEDIGVLDGALPLIRGDNPWQQPFTFYADGDATPLDLTGKSIEAEMRWSARGGGSRPVTVTIDNAAAGECTLSLTADQTAGLPFGRLVTLFVQVVDGSEETTWVRAAIDVKEGLDS